VAGDLSVHDDGWIEDLHSVEELGGVGGVVVQGGNVKHRRFMRETLYKFEIKWGGC
jgi:hypothetical protein